MEQKLFSLALAALVFPPATVLLAKKMSRERKISLFRDIVTLMGRTTMHKRMFFKFQSITNTENDIALEAFPSTPWVFVYRQPVQTMMSHIGNGAGAAPCLRSKSNPTSEVVMQLLISFVNITFLFTKVRNTISEYQKKGHAVSNAAWYVCFDDFIKIVTIIYRYY